MNRFTLQFIDPQLEIQYKRVLTHQIYKKVFYAFNLCTQFFLLLKIIDGAINKNQNQLEVKIAYFTFLFLLFIITYKWIATVHIALFLSNMLLMVFQIMQREDEIQHTFIFGENQMCIHTILLLMTDFQQAAVGNIIIYIFRQSVGEIKSPNGLGYQDHLYSFAVQTFLMICLYYKNLYQRRFFLLSLKDQEIDKMFLELIQKPALIFTYNEENIKFEQRKIIQFQSLQKIENPLNFFLRESKYENGNLESYILSRIKSRKCSPIYFIQELLIIYKNQPKLITYAESYLTFFIIIQSDDPKLAEIQLNNSIKMDKVMKSFNNLISQSSQLLHKAMKSRNLKLLIDLQICYLKIIERNDYYKTMEMKNVNLQKTVKQILQLYNIQCPLICQSQNPIELTTIKRKLIILLMELFRHTSFQQTFSCVRIEQQEEGPTITIRAGLSLPKTKQFRILFGNLVQNYYYQNKSHIFIFREEPFNSYQDQV